MSIGQADECDNVIRVPYNVKSSIFSPWIHVSGIEICEFAIESLLMEICVLAVLWLGRSGKVLR